MGDSGSAPTPSTFDDPSRWATYTKAGGGYVAGPFDGRFAYFLRTLDVDGADAGTSGARILRFDTTSATFDDDAAWSTFDAEGVGTSGGHLTAVLEGKYLVVAANEDSKFIRYDTTRPLTDFVVAKSWETYDAAPLGAGTLGYNASFAFDGGTFYNNGNYVAPLEHTDDAFDTGWVKAEIDAGAFACRNTSQGACVGSQFFFGPSGGANENCIARFDPTIATFGTIEGWDSTDLTTLGADFQFLAGMIPSDKHIYLTQYQTADSTKPTKLFRKPLAGGLDAGWESEPTNVKNPLAHGFWGGAFDGRYVYLAPYPTSTTTAIFGRYDTTLAITDPTAWSAMAAGEVGVPANRFRSAIFDGQYVYFPSYAGIGNETPTFARFKAYDKPIAVPSLCK